MKCARLRLRFFATVLALALVSPGVYAAPAKPNIVVIYADDLGYGDVGCYGARRLATPNIDRMAKEGLRFTDGHSPSATCTPSRYAMFTGEYAWRRKGTGVLPGNAKLIIQPGRVTMASVLKQAGYKTGVVGKWHLGLGSGELDWNGEIKPGPLEIGFDSAFIMAATGDRVPCVFIENHRVFGLDSRDPIQVSYGTPVGDWPTGRKNPELLKLHPSHGHDQTIVNGISRIGYMTGGRAALWKDEDLPDVFLQRALDFIEKNRSAPFFLYYALHEPHVPRVPHPRFVGRSGLGPRGDAIMQLDWSVGEVLKTLDRLQLTENTLVIFTSDNGPVVDDGYQDEAVAKLGEHRPAGPWRGGKYNSFEGGTRVPFIVRWPGRVQPGVSDALICHVDFPATFAALTGQRFKAATAPDSQDQLPAMLGDSPQGRELLVEHSGAGLALRQGLWKLIEKRAGPGRPANDPAPLLFDLATDPGETNNVAAQHPEKAATLLALLEKERARAGDATRAAASERLGENPNIVFILADDLGRGDVGFEGGTEIKTPNLDKLAASGARLAQFYVQPVCSPTRAALLTGRYPMRHGLQVGVVRPWAQYGLPLDEHTLPQALKEAGYTTAIVGKWHLGHFQPAYLPTQRGFDHQYGHYNGMLDYYEHTRDGGFDWHRDDRVCRDDGYTTFLLAREAVRLIQKQPRDKPLFLYVPFNAVHTPHQVPAKYKEPYANLPEPRRTYAGMLAAMDEAIGQIASALDEKGARTNTLIIFSSDNGGPQPGKVTSNGPFRAGKGTLYEGGVRVSAFASWPGRIKAGTVVNQPLHIVDWYPTLLNLAGANLRQKLPLDGRDAWPTLAHGQPSPHDEILLNTTPRGGAIRVGDWKLVLNGARAEAESAEEGDALPRSRKEVVELFNLAQDPYEKSNLAVQEPDKVKQLRARYDAFAREAVPPKSAPKPTGFQSPKVWGETE